MKSVTMPATPEETPRTAAWGYTSEASLMSRPVVGMDMDADGNEELWTFNNITKCFDIYEWTVPDTKWLMFSNNLFYGNDNESANYHEVLTPDPDSDGRKEYIALSTNGTRSHFLPFGGTGVNNGIYMSGYSTFWALPDQCVDLDFDNDGNTEYIVSIFHDNCMIFEGTGLPSAIGYLPSSPAVDLATCVDFDKDGTKDFFTGGNATDSTIRMWESSGNNAFTQVWSLAVGTSGCSLGTGDSDGDGANELYINDLYGTGVLVYECTGNDALTLRTQFDSPGGAGCFNVVDTDGNGDWEIIFEVNSSLGMKQIRDYEATADNTWLSKWNSTDIPGVPGNVFALDIDHDLYCEIITNSWNNTYIFQSDVANGTVSPPTGLSISINGGQAITNSTNVTLTVAATGATQMCFSDNNLNYSNWEAYSSTKQWNLTVGAGTKTVYFRARNSQGTANFVLDTIEYVTIPDAPTLYPFALNKTTQKSVTLNWSKVAYVTNYSVYRELSNIITVVGLTPLANVSSLVNSYIDRGVEANKTYYYVITARNDYGESAPSECRSINITIPNIFQRLFELLAKVDPLTKEIISKAIDLITNYTGSDVVGFLDANGDVVLTPTLNLGEFTADMGLGLELGLTIRAHFNETLRRVEFTFTANLNVGFDLTKLKFKEPFSLVAKIFKVAEKMGISFSVNLIAQLSIKFFFSADDMSFGLMNVCVRINPYVEFTVRLIPLLLNLKPEVKQTIDMIQKPMAKWLKYDIYNIIVVKVGIGVNLVAQYNFLEDRFIADAQLALNIKAELDVFQPKKVKTPEISLRLEGLAGVHFDSKAAKKLSFCGAITFIARVNTGEMGLLRYVINPILNKVSFAPNKDHPFSIVSLGSGCSGFVTCNPSPAADDPDNDSDYLSDADETTYGTNLTHPDTEGDGVWDYLEVQLGTDPLSPDSDGDTLSDYEEYFIIGSNPLSNDTDGDGILDADEWYTYGTDLTSVDTDADGLYDNEELLYGTNPLNNDTDSDGYEDGLEQLWYGSNPLSGSSVPADSDGDGLLDKDEVEIYRTSPTVSNAADSDGDGLTNIQEMILGTSLNTADTDYDGLSDYDEYFTYHTYFNDPDSDGDGFKDGEEVSGGFDPLDANSHGLISISNLILIAIIAAACVAGLLVVKYVIKKRRKSSPASTAPQETKTEEADFDWDNLE